ncbi:YfhD family protein [Fictibacillus enclensis]|uniref:YfhD family protein n=1 Tax=Fictibacillus enclensis TaxID=1017270 RepID=UPI0025A08499|nr:YfhD family protein [Fictibacillus enclensis]MDM5336651.1 YfhD family protein [Fictibacillus enclensis]
MGRGNSHKQPARDKNKAKLPQTPKYEIVHDNQEAELAQELTSQYELTSPPGFEPTEVVRKDEGNK